MSSHNIARAGAILGLAACLAVGFYGTHMNGVQNGFYATLTKITGKSAEDVYIPGGPSPYTYTYTGIGAIDRQLRILVGFFGGFLHGDSTWPVTVASRYLTLQFGAGWTLLSLEGLRNGNRGRSVSWTGTMGIIFQNIAYTCTVPIYLIIHMFTSPTAKSKAVTSSSIAVDPVATKILPLCVLLGFGVPTLAMSLPTPSVLSPWGHYMSIAIWQFFPLCQSLALFILTPLFSSRYYATSQRSAVKSVYKFILGLCLVSQVSALAVALIPHTAVAGLDLPLWVSEMLKEVDLSAVFVPTSPANPPSINPASVDIIPTDWLAPLAVHFLQWDIYAGNVAVLIWANFLYCVSASLSAKSSVGVFVKAIFWFLIGGPIAAATILVWERDEAVYEKRVQKGKKSL